jgi:hypothetical protein
MDKRPPTEGELLLLMLIGWLVVMLTLSSIVSSIISL